MTTLEELEKELAAQHARNVARVEREIGFRLTLDETDGRWIKQHLPGRRNDLGNYGAEWASDTEVMLWHLLLGK